MIGANHLFVVAHAHSLGLILVTNNTQEFERVRGLAGPGRLELDCRGLQGALSRLYFNCFSIAPVTSFESGVTAGSKRCTTLPSRSTRNLVKFHLISPLIPEPVSLVR